MKKIEMKKSTWLVLAVRHLMVNGHWEAESPTGAE